MLCSPVDQSFIRSCGHYAFLSEAVPAYDHKKNDIVNAATVSSLSSSLLLL